MSSLQLAPILGTKKLATSLVRLACAVTIVLFLGPTVGCAQPVQTPTITPGPMPTPIPPLTSPSPTATQVVVSVMPTATSPPRSVGNPDRRAMWIWNADLVRDAGEIDMLPATFASTFTPVPTLACPTADAEGTVSPAVAIYSITFVVNGVEQVVNDANWLQASAGDQVRVREVTICSVGPFEGSGGRVYVEFDPVDQSGQVIVSEVRGTRAVGVTSGFTNMPGPDYTWTVGNWRHFSVVTVHYPPGGGTQNPNCEGGL